MKTDIIEASGSLQLCAGQEASSEAAIHAMRSIFSGEECEAVLLVDAKNAFNTLNRQATLHNIRIICPAFSTILINTYRSLKLLLQGGEHLLSKEGTTQGDPLAMAMYALGMCIYPLITQLCGPARQVWFADDATAATAKSILMILKTDIIEASGSLQLCAGHFHQGNQEVVGHTSLVWWSLRL